jgi:hypothetical protein
LAEELRAYRARLDVVQAAIDSGDGATLHAVFAMAAMTKRGSGSRSA